METQPFLVAFTFQVVQRLVALRTIPKVFNPDELILRYMI